MQRGICKLMQAATLLLLTLGVFNTPANANDYSKKMELVVDGQQLTLLLKPNQVTKRLRVVNESGIEIASPVATYSGQIQGDADSWVRLTRSARSIDGVISRFGKRFRLQQSGNNAAQIKPLAENHDLQITLTANKAVNQRASYLNAKTPVTRIAQMAVVVDSQYNATHRGNGLAYALGILNSIDGIYQEEFGLALQVDKAINIVNVESDPFRFGRVTIENMLRSFRDYRMQSPLLDSSVSFAHLFSGNRPIDEPVGLAWISTACRTDGYDVGLSTPYRHDILLAAHEIAHNLGALHDSETACAAKTDNVMWPYISAGTSQQFSSCTVDAVKRTLVSSCHAQISDSEIALNSDYSEHALPDYRTAALSHSSHNRQPIGSVSDLNRTKDISLLSALPASNATRASANGSHTRSALIWLLGLFSVLMLQRRVFT